VSEFKSATTDFKALRDRRKDLFGEPWHAAIGVENTPKREDARYGPWLTAQAEEIRRQQALDPASGY
jgi:hypothetical protein